MSQSGNNWPYVINLSNSIIGISALAMPFCFKQCGILLGILILLFSTWLTIVSCQILMKAGVTSRRSSYGFLAYHTYGVSGKLAVELGMIGLQIGTMIAQIVVIGDFGPDVLSKIFGIQNSTNLRTFLIMFLCLCVGLPLGLLKDLRAVSRASTICVCFYVVFIIYVLSLSTPHLINGNWYPKVSFWNTNGLFETLSIFAYSFGCQTQLFILYEALPEPSLKTVNGITSSAVNLCAVAYLLMGFFGYIAFHESNITADIIKLFPVSVIADLMKFGFVVSIAITLPLIIFPCRVSLYNLLFSQTHLTGKGHDDVPAQTHIPEIHFKVLTFFIVLGPMIVAILVPNVEFILSFNGATMGTLMCFVFPAVFFLKVNKGESNSIARIVLVCGVAIMFISTFTILKPHHGHSHDHNIVKNNVAEIVKKLDLPDKTLHLKSMNELPDKRIEPANPQAPDEKPKSKEKTNLKERKKDDEKKEEEVGQEKEAAVQDADKKRDVLEEKLKEKEKEIKETELKQKDLLIKLEKQQEESKKILEAQKEIMEELKDHHKEHVDNKQIAGQAAAQGPGDPMIKNKDDSHMALNLNIVPVPNNPNIVPVQNNLNQAPIHNNLNPLPVQNNLNQVPVQNNANQVPFQNNANQVPVQNNLNQAPIQNNLNQIPIQNNLNQIPVLNNPVQGQAPVQNNLGQLHIQNNQVPVVNNLNQAPIQNLGNIPLKGNINQAPILNPGQVAVKNNMVPLQNKIQSENSNGRNIPVANIQNNQVLQQNVNPGFVPNNPGLVPNNPGFVPNNQNGNLRNKRDIVNASVKEITDNVGKKDEEGNDGEKIVANEEQTNNQVIDVDANNDELKSKLREVDNVNAYNVMSRSLLSERLKISHPVEET